MANAAAINNTHNSNEYTPLMFWHGVFIWGLATLFYFYDNLLNVSPSVMKPELAAEFVKSAADLGALSSCYLWAYGLMQIPAGILMDKVGPRKVFCVAGILCAIGSFAFGSAESLALAKWGRIFIGVGASFAVVGCTKIASVWFSPRRFALFIGLMISVGFCGYIFGLSFVTQIVSLVGWRTAMLWGAGAGASFAVLLFLVVRDKPRVPIFVPQVIKEEGLLVGLKEVASCPQAWVAAFYAGLMFVPTLAFGALWGTPFLVEAHGFSREAAGQLISLIFVGWAIGGPIYGWVSDHMGKRNPAMIFANITTLLVTIAIIYVTNAPLWLTKVLMFSLGFFSSGFVIAFAVMREKNRPEIAGTAVGFMNMLNTFGGAFFQYLIGKILDVTASDVIVTTQGDKIFSLGDYQTALISIIVCLAVSLIIVLFVEETYCKPKGAK